MAPRFLELGRFKEEDALADVNWIWSVDLVLLFGKDDDELGQWKSPNADPRRRLLASHTQAQWSPAPSASCPILSDYAGAPPVLIPWAKARQSRCSTQTRPIYRKRVYRVHRDVQSSMSGHQPECKPTHVTFTSEKEELSQLLLLVSLYPIVVV